MPTGLSLHVGLNSVDPDRYDGWDGALVACENDARDMARLARAAGFSDTVLLTREGTVDRITAALRDAAQRLASGDTLLFTYSGHGGQVRDVATGPDTETDRLDETLVFFDRQFLDDELHQEFLRFDDGVRIVTYLDCCHSGSSIEIPGAPGADAAGRYMPEPKQAELYERDRDFYDDLQRSLAKAAAARNDGQGPPVLLISGCQDNQTAADGAVNGAFTEALLEVWGDGAFRGDYRDFHRAIQGKLPPTQSPNLYTTGAPSNAFLEQRPFTV
ncbi:caspase domain-containing protein [Streptomyces sp. NPDC085481]|uniref:caspase domain-containing protein n=1 Tax=Streptomyces sp. NPDC085481 TaxID=3365727 RepID=UPI0037D16CCF